MYKCKVYCLVNSLLIGSFRLMNSPKEPFFVGWEGGGKLIMSPVLQVKECNKVRGHVVLGFDTLNYSFYQSSESLGHMRRHFTFEKKGTFEDNRA